MERMKLDVMARKAALGLLILFAVLAMGVVPAFAERGCLGDPAITGRTCAEETCLSLQAAVNAKCKNQQIFSCARLSTCAALREMRQRWVDCGNARLTINTTCWRGGDPAHQDEVGKAWKNVATCDALIAVVCNDPCPQASGALQSPDSALIALLDKLVKEGELDNLVRDAKDSSSAEEGGAGSHDP